MDTRQQSLDTLKEIRAMMERSSRFISLSGWSGVAAGICALVGAWFGNSVIDRSKVDHDSLRKHYGVDDSIVGQPINIRDYMGSQLLQIAVITLAAAILLAFFFTYLKSKKSGTPLWGIAARRLSVSMFVPMSIGGLYLLKLMQAGAFGLIAPGCLLFYGLALVNASKYTLGEIKWLGYAQLITGTICLFYPGYGIYFWAFGFGVLHILYGMLMWFRYELN